MDKSASKTKWENIRAFVVMLESSRTGNYGFGFSAIAKRFKGREKRRYPRQNKYNPTKRTVPLMIRYPK